MNTLYLLTRNGVDFGVKYKREDKTKSTKNKQIWPINKDGNYWNGFALQLKFQNENLFLMITLNKVLNRNN